MKTVKLNQVRFYGLVFLLSPLLYGCSSLSTTPPERFDLTGDWQLNAALSDSPSLAALGGRKGKGGKTRGAASRGPNGGAGGGRPQGGPGGGGGQAQGRGSRGAGGQAGRSRVGPGGRVQVGVLSSQTIAIEQSHESMGMEFDSGRYRDVSWGERVRGELKVETGWDERELVINSKGGRMPVSERYSLSDDRQRLRVVVELNGGRDDMTFLRIYDRQPEK